MAPERVGWGGGAVGGKAASPIECACFSCGQRFSLAGKDIQRGAIQQYIGKTPPTWP